MMMHGEVGRYPFCYDYKKRMVKNPGNKLNRVMYDILYDLHKRFVHINVD